MKIFVRKFIAWSKEEELNALFSEHGSVSSVRIVRDISNRCLEDSDLLKWYESDAKKALKTLNDFWA